MICSKCKEDKSCDLFSKRYDRPKGYQSRCKDCEKEYRLLNKDKIHKRNIAFLERNQGYSKSYWAIYKKEKAKEIREYRKKYYNNNKHKTTCLVNKRKAIKSKTLLSLEGNVDRIEQIYKIAKRLEEIFGIKFHVDHILPVNGQGFNGLHCWWNLRVITSHTNLSKGNRFNEEDSINTVHDFEEYVLNVYKVALEDVKQRHYNE